MRKGFKIFVSMLLKRCPFLFNNHHLTKNRYCDFSGKWIFNELESDLGVLQLNSWGGGKPIVIRQSRYEIVIDQSDGLVNNLSKLDFVKGSAEKSVKKMINGVEDISKRNGIFKWLNTKSFTETLIDVKGRLSYSEKIFTLSPDCKKLTIVCRVTFNGTEYIGKLVYRR